MRNFLRLEVALESLPKFLCELDRIGQAPATHAVTPAREVEESSGATPAEVAEINRNPAIKSTHNVNPDAMLELLRRMMLAADQKLN